MKITREINGVQHEFELTANELYNAHAEQEHIYDTANVKNAISDLSDGLASDLAYEVRRQIDKYDLDFDYALGEAVVDFNEDLEKDRIEHANLQSMLKTSQHESRMHKRQLEKTKLALEAYWGKYLTDPDMYL